MAYGLKYTGYKQRGTDRVTVNIYAKDWTGTTYELATLTGLSLQIQGAQGTPYSPLIKTSVAIALRDAFDEGSTASDGTTCVKDGGKWGQWEEFYTNDSTKFRVELLHGSTVIWKGYITPDSWGEDMTYRGVINLTARDMLGALSEKEFDLTGAVSIRDIVEGAMTAGEIPMAVSFEDEECLVNSNDENILDATVQASVFGGKSWQEALERTLESTGLVLRYDGQGGFYVTSLRYAYTHAIDTVTPQFTGGSGYRSLDPAARQIVDVFDPKFENYESKDADTTRFLIQQGTYDQTYRVGTRTVQFHELRKYQVSADTDGNGWRGDLATLPTVSITERSELNLCIPTDCDNTGYIEYRDSALLLPTSMAVNALLINTGTTWNIEQSSSISVKSINLQVRVTVAGQTQYLTDVGTWSTVESTLTVAAGENIIIPELAGASNLAVRILKIETECKVIPYYPFVAAPVLTFSAPEYTDLAGEYKTTTIYNESNHIEINRKPEIGSANTTLAPVIASNILAFDGVAAPDEWGFSDMNGHYPLAVLVQAQLLVLYAAQNGNSIFTGSFIQSDKRTALPGKAYTYYQRSCAMLAGTFDFISGTAQSVTLREIAQWSDVWDSFDPDWTQRESAQAGGTAASGGGASGGGGGQGGGGGLTPAQKTLLANLDSWFGQDADGNIFVKKDSEGNERNFYSFGEITAGGIGSGGGGGAKFLYQLEDIYNNGPIILRADGTARQNGDALAYDSTQNKWVASPIQSGASSFAQLTGSPYDNTNLATALNGKQDALGYTPVNKAGDTMSGVLTISKSNVDGDAALIDIKDTSNGTNTDFHWAINATRENIAQGGHQIILVGRRSDTNNQSYFGFRYYADGSINNAATIGLYAEDDIVNIYADRTVTIGDSTTAHGTYKLNVNGTLNAATIYQNGVALGARAFDNTAYLPISAGGSYPLTGNLYFTAGQHRILFENSGGTLSGYVAWTENNYGNYIELYNSITLKGIWIGDMNTTAPIFWDGSNQRVMYHSGNLTAATLGAETTAHAAATYLPLSGGTMTGTIINTNTFIWRGGPSSQEAAYSTYLAYYNGNIYLAVNGIANIGKKIYLESYDTDIEHWKNGVGYKMYDASNCNNTSIPWSASSLTLNGAISGSTSLQTNVNTLSPPTNAGNLGAARLALTGWAGHWGLYAWSSENGNIYCQQGREDGTVAAYNIVLQPFGGNVGIRASSPSYPLHISAATGNGSPAIWVGSTSSAAWNYMFSGIAPSQSSGNNTIIDVGTDHSLGNAAIFGHHYVSSGNSANHAFIGMYGCNYLVNCFYSGNVTIGTQNNTDYGQRLYVAGNIVATGEVTAGSDSRWKDNQTPVTNGIDIIRQLRPMTWTWNEQFAEKNYIGKQSAGLIAQQVASVLPFAVRGNQENGYTLDYNVFHAYEISAIQSHETRIERLERENAELKMEIQRLRS